VDFIDSVLKDAELLILPWIRTENDFEEMRFSESLLQVIQSPKTTTTLKGRLSGIVSR
jgi:hypothetical protein